MTIAKISGSHLAKLLAFFKLALKMSSLPSGSVMLLKEIILLSPACAYKSFFFSFVRKGSSPGSATKILLVRRECYSRAFFPSILSTSREAK